MPGAMLLRPSECSQAEGEDLRNTAEDHEDAHGEVDNAAARVRSVSWVLRGHLKDSMRLC